MRAAAALCLLLLRGSASAAAPPKRDYNSPAVDDYAASAGDFARLEHALNGALKAAPKLYPDGVASFDIILQDTTDFYIYSRDARRPWKKVRRWRGYQVYRIDHRLRPREHEMWGCAAGVPDAMEVDDRRLIAERSLRCAPWGSFLAAQRRRRSAYRYPEAYDATILHELGHLYEDLKGADPTPVMERLSERSRTAPLPPGVDRALMAREVFAEYCELAGSRTLYPSHYARLLDEARAPDDKDQYGHNAALRLALEELRRGPDPMRGHRP